ncbi:MAG: tetratricopeptide repeat protein [Acidobacteriia bacterium]|nr:tetratricopeptide repeat protein [Terriglobia bacterium]
MKAKGSSTNDRSKRSRPCEGTPVAARKRATPAQDKRPSLWPYALGALAAAIMVFWAYGPVMNGPFLFDDTALPFALPAFKAPLLVWLRSDVRPVLFFTYWANARMGQDDPYPFHVFNVLIHLVNSGLVFLIVRRLLDWSRETRDQGVARGWPRGRPGPPHFFMKYNLPAAFAAAIFLLHPVETEAVAYLAGRSESLSAMFVLAAFGVFLYRRQAVASWAMVAAILALFALALLSKQNTISLPALLLLTDYWWNPGFSFQGVRANWKLYLPMALGAVAGVAFFWRVIMTAETAGFGMKDLTWYQYFFTQCRALFVYIGMFLLPARLTADWDFSISRTILDRGAIVGLVLLLALAAIAWRYRRRFPLASYGFFVYLVMMAPTSSFLPIRDAIAERRLYFAMLGLLLIVVDLLGRLKVDRKALVTACVVVLLVAAGLTHARAAVWSDPIALWEDTASKAPNKRRVRFQLGAAYLFANEFDRAAAEFEKTAQLEPPDHNLLVDWGLALDGLNRMDDAIAKLQMAALMAPTAHVYTQIAMVYAKRSRWTEALDALTTAEKIDGNFATIYVYRGNVFMNTNQPVLAIPEYERALKIQPDYEEALLNLRKARNALQSVPH